MSDSSIEIIHICFVFIVQRNKTFLFFRVHRRDATRKTDVFLHTIYLENEAKSTKRKTELCLIHLNKPACEIWSCFWQCSVLAKNL